MFLKDNVRPNDVVLIKDANLLPCQWKLGCIDKIIVGSDGNVRVVLIKTANGLIKRGISQIPLLPLHG